jgi:hypothetical protein
MDIAVTTTAVLRPEILERTYSSLRTNVLGNRDVPLYINVDPIGNGSVGEVYSVARKYFDRVTMIVPDSPNFARALQRVWGFAKDHQYILHIEDDWTFEKIDLEEVAQYMDLHNVEQAGFRASLRCFHRSLVLSPSLLNGSYVKGIVDKIALDKNPEEHLRTLKECRTRMRYFPYDDIQITYDIGTEHRDSIGYVRGEPSTFLRWEKKDI